MSATQQSQGWACITFEPMGPYVVGVDAPGLPVIPDLAGGGFVLALTPDRTVALSCIYPTKDPGRYRLHVPLTEGPDSVRVRVFDGDFLAGAKEVDRSGVSYCAAPLVLAALAGVLVPALPALPP